MNSISRVVAALLASSLLAAPAQAKKHWSLSDKKDVPHVDVTVDRGDTHAGDIATSGHVVINGKQIGDVAVFGGTLEGDGEIIGSVAAFGSSATMGKVNGDVASFGGNVTINGKVSGEVAVTGGNINLGPKAVVTGDVALLGGKLNKADGAEIEGSISNLDLGLAAKLPARLAKQFEGWSSDDKDETKVEAKEEKKEEGFGHRLGIFAGFVVFVGCVGLLVALLSVFLPRPVDAVAQSVKSDFWGAAGTGVLIMLAFFPGLIMLAVSVLGIPLIPLALIAAAAAFIMALAASSRLAGERLFESLQKPQPGNAAVAALLGYLALVTLTLIGRLIIFATNGLATLAGVTVFLAGLMVVVGSLVAGLGGVWRTRMGSRP